MDRRTILAAIGAVLTQAAASDAQPSAGNRAPVFQHDLPDLELKGWSATAVIVPYAPGGKSAPHRHPGITFAYVLEGEIVSKVGDEPETTYTTGQMWMETPASFTQYPATRAAPSPPGCWQFYSPKKENHSPRLLSE